MNTYRYAAVSATWAWEGTLCTVTTAVYWESCNNLRLQAILQIQGARLVCPLGCSAFGPKMASSNYVTKENYSLYVASLSIYGSDCDQSG